MTTGQIIKQLREKASMTQDELARLMGYSHKSSINKIEIGKADLPQSKLVTLAKIFNVNPCVLLGYSDPATDKVINQWDKEHDTDVLSSQAHIFKTIQQIMPDVYELLMEYNDLSEEGKKEAVLRVRELGFLPKYKKDADE